MRAEAIQCILRSNHFAMTSLKQVSENLQGSGESNQFLSEMQSIKEKNLKTIQTLMPEERARPSILNQPSQLLSQGFVCSSLIMGKEKTQVILSSIERGFQADIDEQLRILNESGVEDAALRKLLIQMRDDSFELLEKSGERTKLEQQI